MRVRAQTAVLGILYDFGQSQGQKKAGESQAVEITDPKNQQPPLRPVKFQAADGSFRQATAAELAILTFWKLRYAHNRAQELSNEFARLLNRGSSLE